jgi:nicotinamide mononucleotide (NMN) deamidase PncC
MVCFGWAFTGGEVLICTEYFNGNRQQVRQQAIARALQGVLDGLR